MDVLQSKLENINLEDGTIPLGGVVLKAVPMYTCSYKGCEELFNTKEIQKFHVKTCKFKPVIKKCHWYVSGRRCKFRGLYNGYCSRHNNNYKYNPDGFKDEEDQLEPCTYTSRRKYVPTSVSVLNDFMLSSLTYIWKGNKYTIKEVMNTYVIMENIDMGCTVTVWDPGSRKTSGGPMITSMYTFKEHECENRAAVLMDDEDYYCEECFEDSYGTVINSLVPNVSLEQ